MTWILALAGLGLGSAIAAWAVERARRARADLRAAVAAAGAKLAELNLAEERRLREVAEKNAARAAELVEVVETDNRRLHEVLAEKGVRGARAFLERDLDELYEDARDPDHGPGRR